METFFSEVFSVSFLFILGRADRVLRSTAWGKRDRASTTVGKGRDLEAGGAGPSGSSAGSVL